MELAGAGGGGGGPGGKKKFSRLAWGLEIWDLICISVVLMYEPELQVGRRVIYVYIHMIYIYVYMGPDLHLRLAHVRAGAAGGAESDICIHTYDLYVYTWDLICISVVLMYEPELQVGRGEGADS
jgi:hypothetical protein